jgi:hypothetical protein
MVAERLAKHLWLVMIAPIVVGVVSALTTAMVTGDFRPWENRATLTRTELRLYTAGTVFGLPAGMKITGTAKGVCNEDSNVLRVPEAHRCSGGKYICDPCLEAGTPDFSLVCVDAPWENKAIRFRPTAFYYLLRGKKYGKYGKYVKVPANNPSPAPPPTLEPTLAQVTSPAPRADHIARVAASCTRSEPRGWPHRRARVWFGALIPFNGEKVPI